MLLSIKISGGIPPAERAGISPSWIQQNTTPSKEGHYLWKPFPTKALAAARAKLDAAESRRENILLFHIANGVNIESRTIQIDEGVVIAPGATILADTILRGKTVIGAGCVIGPNTLIEDTHRDEVTTVNASQVYGSHLGPHNNIGPFTHVRVNTVTDYGVHLGAYVETKNSNFARGNTVSHLTYIGDSDVGKYCNFGCGTVTCNYDGKDKFRTQIGDYCFIGCNTNLVAPVKVGDGAYTAAGSTITKDVPAQALGIARERQTNLEGWAAPKMEAYIAKSRSWRRSRTSNSPATYKVLYKKAPPCICTDIGRLCVFPAKQISFSSRVCYTKELYHTLF